MNSPAPTRQRLHGVDLARFVALAAMMVAHIIPRAGGQAAHTMVDGRAAALFAVLAGVSVALASGGRHPARWAPAARGLLARAGVVAAIGLTLGVLPSGLAVILVNYGLLFAVAALFVPLSARTLGAIAFGWLALAPQLAFLVRSFGLPGDSPGPVPSWIGLQHPLDSLTQLTVTGYYPVFTWTGYLLVGMAIGRSRLLARHDRRTGLTLLLGGAAAAVFSWLVVHGAEAVFSVQSELIVPPQHPQVGTPVVAFYGTTPTTTWWWALTDYRHSGTTPDLLATSGLACATLGVCVLLVRLDRLRRLSRPLQLAGSMPLTLYCLHVLIETVRPPVDLSVRLAWLAWALQVIFLVGLAVALRGRGPLELLTREVATAAAGRTEKL